GEAGVDVVVGGGDLDVAVGVEGDGDEVSARLERAGRLGDGARRGGRVGQHVEQQHLVEAVALEGQVVQVGDGEVDVLRAGEAGARGVDHLLRPIDAGDGAGARREELGDGAVARAGV